ncbi:MAG TPA: 5'-nucleotidase C-terminal domain-containing protein [Herpetosiphonaceae bacterium]
MRRFVLLALICLACSAAAAPAAAQQRSTVTLLHFSDYHSHAVPFYAEGQTGGGIARALRYLREAGADPSTLVLGGGDTMNLGAPAWSDKYRCLEWPWFNGILDAMAYGNHDSDYGPEVFAQCRAQISYPILGANVVDAAGQPLFLHDGRNYAVLEAGGVKIGVFALAGADFERLIRPELRPAAGAAFSDRVAAARAVVAELREREGVGAVALIGHALREDDIALAQAVPGIDIIFGSHSHRKESLFKIAGTETWMISSFQYLSYVSRLELSFADGALTGVSGGLVRMGPELPEDPAIAAEVARLQAELAADPTYAPLFQRIGTARAELSTEGQFSGEAGLGNFVMDIVRADAKAHFALSTASSFREPIPPGEILEETLRAAMPYPNAILVYQLSGAQIAGLLDWSVSRSGSDFFAQVAGVRFNIVDGKAANMMILRDPADPGAGFAPLDPARTYEVATTNFLAQVAAGYKERFAGASFRETGLEVRAQTRAFIQANSPVGGGLDGRITLGAPAPVPTALPSTGIPARLPNTGAAPAGFPQPIAWLLGLLLLAAGGLARRAARR